MKLTNVPGSWLYKCIQTVRTTERHSRSSQVAGKSLKPTVLSERDSAERPASCVENSRFPVRGWGGGRKKTYKQRVKYFSTYIITFFSVSFMTCIFTVYIFGYTIKLLLVLSIIQNVNEYAYPSYYLNFYAFYNKKFNQEIYLEFK